MRVTMMAVDPGIRGCGRAVFSPTGELVSAAYVANPIMAGSDAKAVRAMVLALGLADEVVVEWPQVYRAGRGRGDPNDLLPLTAIAGGLASRMLIPVFYRPREWKGQVPKEIMIERVKGRLTAEEHGVVVLSKNKALNHNIWDAIGIGLYHLGRLD